MQTRLDALQELKDEVETAERFITDMNQRVRSLHLTLHFIDLLWRVWQARTCKRPRQTLAVNPFCSVIPCL